MLGNYALRQHSGIVQGCIRILALGDQTHNLVCEFYRIISKTMGNYRRNNNDGKRKTASAWRKNRRLSKLKSLNKKRYNGH